MKWESRTFASKAVSLFKLYRHFYLESACETYDQTLAGDAADNIELQQVLKALIYELDCIGVSNVAKMECLFMGPL